MDNDHNTTEYLAKLGQLKLSDSSRTRIENNLAAYARFHSVQGEGVRVGGDGRSIAQVPSRTSFITYLRNLQLTSMTAALVAIMLVIGGGTSYAAESAVPGDFLYSIKTDVNENIENVFAFSDESKAELQVRLVEERLEEAEILAARGELSAAAATDISARLKTHYEAVDMHTKAAEATGDFTSGATLQANMEGNLRTHAALLTDLNTRVVGNDGMSLISVIGTYIGLSAAAQTNATATIKTSTNAKVTTAATIQSANTIISAAQTKLTRAESTLSAEVTIQVKARLAEAVRAQVNAQASFEVEAFSAAYVSAQAAIRLASEADSLIASGLRLPLEVGGASGSFINGSLKTTLDSDTDTTLAPTGATTTKVDTTTSGSPTGEDNSLDVQLDTTTTVNTGVIDATSNIDTNIQTGLGR